MLVFDIEVSKNNTIQDIGAISDNNKTFHNPAIDEFDKFIKKNKLSFFAGHNIIKFDLKHLNKTKLKRYFRKDNVIDTLYLSALLFPEKPYHKLVKDDKIISDYANNPYNDSVKAKHLLFDAINEFNKLNKTFKDILYLLLKDVEGFEGFFKYIKYKSKRNRDDLNDLIFTYFYGKICFNRNISGIINKYALEFAYVLSYANINNLKESLLPPWLLNNFPKVEDVMTYLRGSKCTRVGCEYCTNHLSSLGALKKYFNYDNFRVFDGVNLQENAVESALNHESLIAVFPTGGGKSLTFQLPALIQGDNLGGLTVVISPLQSLMKDQVDNLIEKNITSAAYINGLLNPIERKDVIERVLNGSVNILYIAPESLRSRTILNLLLKRQVMRFVIDEAHCFSTWGHDFRPDYLYIGDFIKELCDKKELTNVIPISCFTATAKHDVVKDIKDYFYEKLGLGLKEFKTSKGRTNLDYTVIKVSDDDNRYIELRNLLDANDVPTIIYSSRIKAVNTLHDRLLKDGFKVSKFHGRMENEDKIINQNKFMSGETRIMVATNAFGMGVDKDDVGVVIHYNISDSLENYIQEAGRAGRDTKSRANCYILYSVEDLDKHFEMLNLNKLSRKEIAQVWSGIKRELGNTTTFSRTALEIARISGWDESNNDIETKIKTSLLTLEDSNYIKRGLNSPRIYATSLLVLNYQTAEKIIDKSKLIPKNEKVTTKRIVNSLISNKRKSWDEYIAESRVDYLSDSLGLSKEIVIRHINYLREIEILADHSDLYAKVDKNTSIRTIKTEINRYREITNYLLETFTSEDKLYNIKFLNEALEINYKPDIRKLRRSINYLKISDYLNIDNTSKDNFIASLNGNREHLTEKLNKLFNLSDFIGNYLVTKFIKNSEMVAEHLIDFSPLELKNEYIKSLGMIEEEVSVQDIETAILLMQRLNIMSFEGGFLVTYLPMTITRKNMDNLSRFTIDDYKKIANHYKNKNQQIHIVGHYANIMSKNNKAAQVFVSDYFNLEYQSFLDKYFPGQKKKELDLKMSKNRYEKLFGNLSIEQKQVIEDDKSDIIGVSAGPGSGKTMLLVHKLASIIFNEDVHTNQLLMLTFSRNAAIEFKDRLKQLIGNVANYIQITTFHSYAFDILGRPGSLEKSENVVRDAVEAIKNNEAELQKVTKTMLVIDEAQDMSEDEYNLVRELISKNDNLRVIAVGDDDQNIFEFRDSNSKYLEKMTKEKKYELSINFRSKRNIVKYSNSFVKLIKNRIKEKEITSHSKDLGIVEITNYKTNNLVQPLINKFIKDKKDGSTAIITRTNEDALLISGILTHQNIKNQLIQNSKNIKPYNLFEVRYFFNLLKSKTKHKIDLTAWNKTMEFYGKRFSKSSNIETYKNMLNKFIEIYNEAYISDLQEFLLETDLNIFLSNYNLIVANLHKVKGMEFDNVYMLYDNTGYLKDDELRVVYVGLTRAKSYLSVHTSNNIFKTMKNEEIVFNEDTNDYTHPKVIEVELNFTDINLGYYKFVDGNVRKLVSGDKLKLDQDGTMLKDDEKVGRLSNKGLEFVENRIKRGYLITNIEVLDIVYWYDKVNDKESLVMIPKIKFLSES